MKEIESKEEVKEFSPKPAQIRYASIYLNIMDRLTQEEIAKEIGITRKTIWNWYKKPEFVRWLNTQKDSLIYNSLIEIYKVAIRKARSGHYLFAKLILEMAGAYQPGLKLDTGETELIKIEVVQAQKQEQKQEGRESKNENN